MTTESARDRMRKDHLKSCPRLGRQRRLHIRRIVLPAATRSKKKSGMNLSFAGLSSLRGQEAYSKPGFSRASSQIRNLRRGVLHNAPGVRCNPLRFPVGQSIAAQLTMIVALGRRSRGHAVESQGGGS
jgi:hypothetical protein